MVASARQSNEPAQALNREEAQRVFDEQTRRYLGVTAAEFVRRHEAGELNEDNPDVLYLLMVRDFAA